ncbi:hypothetical protein SLEP1_g42501 [Rubroshorea leprosula]|uniref:Uncharacterized protein n=1 Tax=Rubroshorea leprosula TaxID=152421 RepID=A0AAV5LAI3_9ROSI|nr:hypothetical protein SLEP1_g42501 [Rubroshorea leprosula]
MNMAKARVLVASKDRRLVMLRLKALMKNMDEALAKNMEEAPAKNMEEAPVKDMEEDLVKNINKALAKFILKCNEKRTKASAAQNFYLLYRCRQEENRKLEFWTLNTWCRHCESCIDITAVLDKGMPYLVVALKESIPNKDEINVDEPVKSILKKAVSSRKIMSKDKSSFVPAKLSDIDNMHNKAKKVMIENASKNLYATVRMKVTPFAEMAYLDKGKFNMAGSDMAGNWDEQIDKLAKHVENVQNSLVDKKELMLKLAKLPNEVA